jgi:hypothetical protein
VGVEGYGSTFFLKVPKAEITSAALLLAPSGLILSSDESKFRPTTIYLISNVKKESTSGYILGISWG